MPAGTQRFAASMRSKRCAMASGVRLAVSRAAGYWLRADATGRGYATEATRAAMAVAAALPGITRLEIRCDPRNTRSAAVPRRLGFQPIRTLVQNAVTPDGLPRDTIIWEWVVAPPLTQDV